MGCGVKTRVLSLLAIAAVLCACSSQRKEQAVVQPAQVPTPQITAQPAGPLPPAKAEDVAQALRRIYGGAVVMASSDYIQGDFNGDGYRDVAVGVKPAAGSLLALNNELANWTVQDVHRPELFPRKGRVYRFPPKPARPVVTAGESLVAVIHGYGPNGWRDEQARQTYLLKNAAGQMQTEARGVFVASVAQGSDRPHIIGDVITESQRGKPGFIFWTGAHYAWITMPVRTVQRAAK